MSRAFFNNIRHGPRQRGTTQGARRYGICTRRDTILDGWGGLRAVVRSVVLAVLLTGCLSEVATVDQIGHRDRGRSGAGGAAALFDSIAAASGHTFDEDAGEDAGDDDAGDFECDWEDTGDRSIVWCVGGQEYHCCTHAELDGPRKHWRPEACPGFCDHGFVAMEDFRVTGPSVYYAALYCIEDRGQCDA